MPVAAGAIFCPIYDGRISCGGMNRMGESELGLGQRQPFQPSTSTFQPPLPKKKKTSTKT